MKKKDKPEQAALRLLNGEMALYDFRNHLREVLTLLDGFNCDGRAGRAKRITGEHVSRDCLEAAISLIITEANHLRNSIEK